MPGTLWPACIIHSEEKKCRWAVLIFQWFVGTLNMPCIPEVNSDFCQERSCWTSTVSSAQSLMLVIYLGACGTGEIKRLGSRPRHLAKTPLTQTTQRRYPGVVADIPTPGVTSESEMQERKVHTPPRIRRKPALLQICNGDWLCVNKPRAIWTAIWQFRACR